MTYPTCVCGRPRKPLEGVYLTLLYPGEFSCLGCGRRSRFCSCDLMAAAVPDLRAQGRQAAIDPFIVRRVSAKWKAQAIAAAGGVSLRTAYRYIKAQGTEDVRVGDLVATFVIRKDQTPTRISEWRQA